MTSTIPTGSSRASISATTASSISALIEGAARRERILVLTGLGITLVLVWVWLARGAGMQTGMPGMDPGFVPVFTMWAVMMIAMMLPGAAPAVLLFAALSRATGPKPAMPSVSVFAAGYLAVWTAFSAVAAGTHLVMRDAMALSSSLRAGSAILSALLLVAAGLYQFTPAKAACLHNCRTPVQFLTQYWRPGPAGAFRLGVLHGGYCVGCCWALMGLLFVGGVMNLWWIAVIAAFVFAEKTLFLGRPAGRIVTGAALMLAGVVVLAAPGIVKL